ncbi:hypothetical protein IAI10_14310 [Clostridium sp. 19966]|nr:hypothetical protein [Clostridium sp. 19966]MDT8717838.1 hypothetical protein [Clostridium sp. 19966]
MDEQSHSSAMDGVFEWVVNYNKAALRVTHMGSERNHARRKTSLSTFF